METLGNMISAALRGGLLSGFYVGHWNAGGINVSHHLFVDDTLTLCGVDIF
jgi:hypothetical protein